MDGPLLRISIRPSKRLQAGLFCGVALALSAPWVAEIPLFTKLLADLFVLGFSAPVLMELSRARESELHLVNGDGFLREAGVVERVEILPDSTVWPFVMVLRLRSVQRTRSLVLLPDSAHRDELRRLRVALRFPVGRSGNEDRVHRPV